MQSRPTWYQGWSLCSRNVGMSLPKLDGHSLSVPPGSLEGNHSMSSPLKRPLWQGTEVSCQQSCQWVCKQLPPTRSASVSVSVPVAYVRSDGLSLTVRLPKTVVYSLPCSTPTLEETYSWKSEAGPPYHWLHICELNQPTMGHAVLWYVFTEKICV